MPDVPDVPDVPDGPQCVSDNDCQDMSVCNGVERCLNGACVPSAGVVCDDGVACTDDRCDDATGACVSTPDDTRCMAPATCNPMVGCTAGECASDAQCDDGDPCNGAETCVARRCVPAPPLRCDDGVACTMDQCVPGRGCVNAPNDALCNDGRFCNGAERCVAGRGCAMGTPILCDDRNPCTSDRCDDTRGACITAPVDADADGFAPASCPGGRDCNDMNRAVNPGATEACGNGVDDNCDGRVDCADIACAATPACAMCMPRGPENTAAACGDGVDQDCDRLVDCADADCRLVPACMMCVRTGPEADPMACIDGRDNDCDGAIDCADVECALTPRCMMCVPTGPEAALCGDGRDNDCDGATDCVDRDCAATPACAMTNETCPTAQRITVPGAASGSTASARDDFTPTCAMSAAPDLVYVFSNPRQQTVTVDTFGSAYDTMLLVFRGDCAAMSQVACNDDTPGVGAASRVVLTDAPAGVYYVVVDGFGGSSGAFQLHLTVGAAEVCTNRLDDDGDGLVDCADPDCAMDLSCRMCTPTGPETTAAACADGRDNDCNTLVDCADPSCAAVPACCRPTAPENNVMTCADGRDDDCDGLIDCRDPECAGVGMCPCVVSPEVCTDVRDNDCDGLVDCRDPDCAMAPSCRMCVPTGAENTAAACADRVDNDCDGLLDCADADCAPTTACTAPGETCAVPLRIALPGMVAGSTAMSRNDFTPACAMSSAPDVVYAFSNPRQQTITVDTIGSAYDTMLLVFRGDCAASSLVACNDDIPAVGTASRVVLTNAPAGVYFVVVDGFGAGSGAYQLRLSLGAPAELCTNRVDDDGDGLVDCADPECAMAPTCLMCVPTGAEGTPVACGDGRDNDCDGASDCADADCRLVPACCRPTGREFDAATCRDGLDNDCNGRVDCAEPTCASQPFCCVPMAAREYGVAACTDGRDNDCDGVADCADSDCQPSRMSGGECCNGVDDNTNSLVDEFACACETSVQCTGVGAGGPFPSNTCWSNTFRVCAPRCNLLGGNVFCSNFFPGTRCDTATGECR